MTQMIHSSSERPFYGTCGSGVLDQKYIYFNLPKLIERILWRFGFASRLVKTCSVWYWVYGCKSRSQNNENIYTGYSLIPSNYFLFPLKFITKKVPDGYLFYKIYHHFINYVSLIFINLQFDCNRSGFEYDNFLHLATVSSRKPRWKVVKTLTVSLCFRSCPAPKKFLLSTGSTLNKLR